MSIISADSKETLFEIYLGLKVITEEIENDTVFNHRNPQELFEILNSYSLKFLSLMDDLIVELY